MVSLAKFLQEVVGDSPLKQWENLTSKNKIKFDHVKFNDNVLKDTDKIFVATFFKKFNNVRQINKTEFAATVGSVQFSLRFLGKCRWAAIIKQYNNTQITEPFIVTEIKINPLFEIFNKAIKQKSFKNILPIL